jgi:hypothetical protein
VGTEDTESKGFGMGDFTLLAFSVLYCHHQPIGRCAELTSFWVQETKSEKVKCPVVGNSKVVVDVVVVLIAVRGVHHRVAADSSYIHKDPPLLMKEQSGTGHRHSHQPSLHSDAYCQQLHRTF